MLSELVVESEETKQKREELKEKLNACDKAIEMSAKIMK